MPRTTMATLSADITALTATVATLAAALTADAAPAAPVAAAPVAPAATTDEAAAAAAALKAAREATGRLCVCGHLHKRPVIEPERPRLATETACAIKACVSTTCGR